MSRRPYFHFWKNLPKVEGTLTNQNSGLVNQSFELLPDPARAGRELSSDALNMEIAQQEGVFRQWESFWCSENVDKNGVEFLWANCSVWEICSGPWRWLQNPCRICHYRKQARENSAWMSVSVAKCVKNCDDRKKHSAKVRDEGVIVLSFHWYKGPEIFSWRFAKFRGWTPAASSSKFAAKAENMHFDKNAKTDLAFFLPSTEHRALDSRLVVTMQVTRRLFAPAFGW